MSRILLDENLPVPMRRVFPLHEVDHVKTLGWAGLANGKLIAAAESSGYAVFVTADRNLTYQQNLVGRRIGILVLSTNRWSVIQEQKAAILAAIETATVSTPGGYLSLSLPHRVSGGRF